MSNKGWQPSAREAQRWERERAEQAGQAEAERLTRQVSAWLDNLDALLPRGVQSPVRLDFQAMKDAGPAAARYTVRGGSGLAVTEELDREPMEEDFAPDPPRRFERLLPGWQSRQEHRQAQARERYASAKQAWVEHEQRLIDAEQQRRRVDELAADYRSAKPPAVREALSSVLAARTYPSEFPQKFALVYRRSNRQLILEYELPTFDDIIPLRRAVEYQKTKRVLKDVPLSLRDRQNLYRKVLAALTLLTIHDLFSADSAHVADRVAFIGVVDTIDKATGQPARPVLISLEVFRDAFAELNLQRVEPAAALQKLHARVSRAPTELEPVDPVIVIDLTDPRKVEEEELLSTLSTNENLLDLNPYKFETLIRDLFAKMGYETFKTWASRDGGVDCVAWFKEPAGKRKTVIQAKRYSNAVGVSDVRDLLGTVQKERAGTGIIVTTSWFTRGAHEFAQGEQLTLWEGPQLLALLHEHVGKQFTIKLPPKKP